jgi:SOS-response transcriptional repressor LexA
MDSIGDAIKKARIASGLTQQQLGEMVGTDNGNISRLERGRQGASQATFEAVCAALGISLSGVIAANTMRANIENTDIPRSFVPVIVYTQIIYWIERMESFKRSDAASWMACPVEHGPRTYALIVIGDSMSAPGAIRSFASGDYIFCDPDKAPKHGSAVLALMADTSEPVFRRLLIEGSKQYLQALNPSWPDRIVEMPPGSEILGTVIFRGEIV